MVMHCDLSLLLLLIMTMVFGSLRRCLLFSCVLHLEWAALWNKWTFCASNPKNAVALWVMFANVCYR